MAYLQEDSLYWINVLGKEDNEIKEVSFNKVFRKSCRKKNTRDVNLLKKDLKEVSCDKDEWISAS